MKEHTLNPSKRPRVGEDTGRVRLAVARNLARIYADVLEERLPKGLQYLLEKWERGDNEGAQRA